MAALGIIFRVVIQENGYYGRRFRRSWSIFYIIECCIMCMNSTELPKKKKIIKCYALKVPVVQELGLPRIQSILQNLETLVPSKQPKFYYFSSLNIYFSFQNILHVPYFYKQSVRGQLNFQCSFLCVCIFFSLFFPILCFEIFTS